MKKIASLIILFAFAANCLMSQSAWAQALELPKPGTMVALSPAFTPAYLKGLVINPNDPFKFDFIIHRGDSQLGQTQKQEEYTKLIKYFLAALAVPDDQQWVNLSPYEKDRIIPNTFGQTEMGRDLLSEDYMLKQITASMIYPEEAIGKKFWQKVYAEAEQKFGKVNIPINTFNKVWIIPDKATVYEKGNTVYVLENHLKVMLEQDYLAMSKNSVIASGAKQSDTGALGSQIIREVILPALEKEVNEGKNFAPLRQVYSGMLLATWYKRTLKESILGKLYANQNKVKGVDQDPKNNQQIYSQYLQAFKKGVFNMIKPDTDRLTNQIIPRKYFSGGAKGYASMAQISKAMVMPAEEKINAAQTTDLASVALQQSVVDAGMISPEVSHILDIIFGEEKTLKFYAEQESSADFVSAATRQEVAKNKALQDLRDSILREIRRLPKASQNITSKMVEESLNIRTNFTMGSSKVAADVTVTRKPNAAMTILPNNIRNRIQAIRNNIFSKKESGLMLDLAERYVAGQRSKAIEDLKKEMPANAKQIQLLYDVPPGRGYPEKDKRLREASISQVFPVIAEKIKEKADNQALVYALLTSAKLLNDSPLQDQLRSILKPYVGIEESSGQENLSAAEWRAVERRLYDQLKAEGMALIKSSIKNRENRIRLIARLFTVDPNHRTIMQIYRSPDRRRDSANRVSLVMDFDAPDQDSTTIDRKVNAKLDEQLRKYIKTQGADVSVQEVRDELILRMESSITGVTRRWYAQVKSIDPRDEAFFNAAMTAAEEKVRATSADGLAGWLLSRGNLTFEAKRPYLMRKPYWKPIAEKEALALVERQLAKKIKGLILSALQEQGGISRMRLAFIRSSVINAKIEEIMKLLDMDVDFMTTDWTVHATMTVRLAVRVRDLVDRFLRHINFEYSPFLTVELTQQGFLENTIPDFLVSLKDPMYPSTDEHLIKLILKRLVLKEGKVEAMPIGGRVSFVKGTKKSGAKRKDSLARRLAIQFTERSAESGFPTGVTVDFVKERLRSMSIPIFFVGIGRVGLREDHQLIEQIIEELDIKDNVITLRSNEAMASPAVAQLQPHSFQGNIANVKEYLRERFQQIREEHRLALLAYTYGSIEASAVISKGDLPKLSAISQGWLEIPPKVRNGPPRRIYLSKYPLGLRDTLIRTFPKDGKQIYEILLAAYRNSPADQQGTGPHVLAQQPEEPTVGLYFQGIPIYVGKVSGIQEEHLEQMQDESIKSTRDSSKGFVVTRGLGFQSFEVNLREYKRDPDTDQPWSLWREGIVLSRFVARLTAAWDKKEKRLSPHLEDYFVDILRNASGPEEQALVWEAILSNLEISEMSDAEDVLNVINQLPGLGNWLHDKGEEILANTTDSVRLTETRKIYVLHYLEQILRDWHSKSLGMDVQVARGANGRAVILPMTTQVPDFMEKLEGQSRAMTAEDLGTIYLQQLAESFVKHFGIVKVTVKKNTSSLDPKEYIREAEGSRDRILAAELDKFFKSKKDLPNNLRRNIKELIPIIWERLDFVPSTDMQSSEYQWAIRVKGPDEDIDEGLSGVPGAPTKDAISFRWAKEFALNGMEKRGSSNGETIISFSIENEPSGVPGGFGAGWERRINTSFLRFQRKINSLNIRLTTRVSAERDALLEKELNRFIENKKMEEKIAPGDKAYGISAKDLGKFLKLEDRFGNAYRYAWRVKVKVMDAAMMTSVQVEENQAWSLALDFLGDLNNDPHSVISLSIADERPYVFGPWENQAVEKMQQFAWSVSNGITFLRNRMNKTTEEKRDAKLRGNVSQYLASMGVKNMAPEKLMDFLVFEAPRVEGLRYTWTVKIKASAMTPERFLSLPDDKKARELRRLDHMDFASFGKKFGQFSREKDMEGLSWSELKVARDMVMEEAVKRTADNAQSAEPLGGIDMNPSNLAMLIKRDGKGMLLPVSQQNLDNIHIDGLVPLILGIRSAADLAIFSN